MIYTKEIEVVNKFDVVVVGGGAAGIGAAIAAGRKGAKTAIIERFGFLGGMATAGYVNPMSEFAYNGKRIIGGIAWEFAQEMVKKNGAVVEVPRCNVSFNPEIYKLVAQEMIENAGVQTFMNTSLIDCIKEENAIKSIIVNNKSGLQAIEAKFFIDATGDADLAHFADVEMLPQGETMQPGTLCFCLSGVDTTTERMHIIHQKNHRFNHQAEFVREVLFKLREEGVDVPLFGGPWLATTMDEGCITVNMTRAPMNATDSADYQKAECKMREDIFKLVALLKEYVPEFKNCILTSIATMAGIRESRRIKGLHVLTGLEYAEGHKFEDSIARACHPIDIHLPGDEGQKLIFPKDAGYIPYRSLITESVDNLLVAGRAISADCEAFAAIRVQAPCMETGQAAGIAASLCCKNGTVKVQDINISELTTLVREQGSLQQASV